MCIVVHIYDNLFDICRRMNHSLEILACSFPHVKFLRLLSEEAPGSDGKFSSIFYAFPNYDTRHLPQGAFNKDTLPVLVIYRGGVLENSLIRVTDEIGSLFEPADVENLLAENGVFELFPRKDQIVDMPPNLLLTSKPLYMDLVRERCDSDDDSETEPSPCLEVD